MTFIIMIRALLVGVAICLIIILFSIIRPFYIRHNEKKIRDWVKKVKEENEKDN